MLGLTIDAAAATITSTIRSRCATTIRSRRSSIRSTRTACTTMRTKCRHRRCCCRPPSRKRNLRRSSAKVAATEKALASEIAEGAARLMRGWPSRKRVIVQILPGYFTFDGDLGKLPERGPGGEGRGIARRRCTSVDGVRGKAVRFDGDRGVIFRRLLEVDRWDALQPRLLDCATRRAIRCRSSCCNARSARTSATTASI